MAWPSLRPGRVYARRVALRREDFIEHYATADHQFGTSIAIIDVAEGCSKSVIDDCVVLI
jgi:hypothetical protein